MLKETMDDTSLSYFDVHLYYTLPVTIILWLLCRPFLTNRLYTEISTLVVVAVVYTTPWDNYLVWTGTWAYPPDTVLGVIGYVPIEEYMFFVIQTVMVVFWSVLCLRWSLPYLYFLDDCKFKAPAIRWIPILPMLLIAIFAWSYSIPKTPQFYLCSIMWWSLPVIAFLWYGTGNYIVKRYRAVTLTILVPSIYLCWVDSVALREGAWMISPESTTGIFVYDVVPLEEAIFFFIVNVILVFAYCGYDKAFGVLDLYPERFRNNSNMILQLFEAFTTLEVGLPQQRIRDLELTLTVLKKSSKSFWAASFLFPPEVRLDLSVLYAFCRVTDDMVDNASSNDERMAKLETTKKFLDELFSDRTENETWAYGLKQKIASPCQIPVINWEYFGSVLNKGEMAAFRSLSSLSYYLPPEPFYELCRGYEWDLTGRRVKTERDLIKYSELVASSVSVLCTYVLCFKSGKAPNGLNEAEHKCMIESAREMGIALQLINIARDIATDSETLGRCYVPEAFFENPQAISALVDKRDPWSLENRTLRELSVKILEISEVYQNRARIGFNELSEETLRPIICATEIYSEIGTVIKKEKGYHKRASTGSSKKLSLVLKCLYLPLSVVKIGKLF